MFNKYNNRLHFLYVRDCVYACVFVCIFGCDCTSALSFVIDTWFAFHVCIVSAWDKAASTSRSTEAKVDGLPPAARLNKYVFAIYQCICLQVMLAQVY